MKNTKKSLFNSVVSLLLCFSMLLGTTYAWFTDSVTSEGNIIKTGNLDIGMYWSDNNADWYDAEGANARPVFSHDNWEPGYTEVRYIKVTNEGTLAFAYQMLLSPNVKVDKLAEVIDVSFDIVTGNPNFVAPTAYDKAGSLTKIGVLSEIISSDNPVTTGALLPSGEVSNEYLSGEIVVCISLHMQESAGNEYQGRSLGSTFDIKLIATQLSYEKDSFDYNYDNELIWPELPGSNNTAEKKIPTDDDGVVTEDTYMSNEHGNISALFLEGTKLDPSFGKTVLNVNVISESSANIVLADNQQSKSLDVHVDGVAADNTTPIAITINEFLPVGLNVANLGLYHVENGETVVMTSIGENSEPAHNTFRYDPATGDVTLYMASFSEVAFVAEPAIWKGDFDYSWYKADETELYIANADQLAAFGAIVGGMNKVTGITKVAENQYQYTYSDEIIRDSFSGKTVTLLASIHIGDIDANYGDASENGIVFYPIGYYNNTGKYEKQSGNVGPDGAAVSSGYRTFEGTFDGNGYFIADFYQNTWEMFGDYNSGYSGTPNHNRDGMGLFGRVYGGTIKNLTISNFSSDGEYSTTGCVAAYADHGATFENIAIINSNPRVYNIGNGGVVGVVGWYNKGVTNKKVTFKNITVDNTNKISALWGSWDVACGGIVGTYYPTSGQSSAEYPANAGISFENCHVGAQIDVNNDVCANYQYYAYRYAGMMIGSVAENEVIDGREYPKMDGLVFSDCTVHFGTWNDYYYCELVDNTTASYTHDYQMSRLVEIKAVKQVEGKWMYLPLGAEDKDDAWLNVPASGRANYVIVDYSKGHGDENATCHHFKNGEVWTHDMGGTEVIDGVEVLKEDKQHLYLEFNNLVTGDGWGVTSKGIEDVVGVTVLDRIEADSIEKFEGRKTNDKLAYPISGREYKISHLFNLLETDVRVIPGALTVTVTNLDHDGNVTAEFTRSASNWADSTIVFSGNGKVRVTIQDYFYCDPTSIDLTVRSYPEGSIILNFTYDGFKNNEEYVIPDTADEITTGKHGTYDFDFGFGPEVLDHALKIDSKGSIGFHATSDGTIAIALASNTVGASLDYKVIEPGQKEEDVAAKELVKIYEANTLVLVHIEVEKDHTYKFVKGDKETAIYYIGYLPDSAVNAPHDCAYYEKTTATCTEGGITTRTCLVCGKGSSFEVGALGHSIVYTEAYDPTCTSEGRKAGSHCANCGGEKEGGTKIDKIKHTYENDICIGCGGFAKDLHTFENGVCTGCEIKIEDAEQSEYNYVIAHSIDFTTGKSEDYVEYRSYFLPRGLCSIDGSGKYVIMKSLESTPAYIEFTVDYRTTLIVTAASTGRENTTDFVLIDAEGNVIAEKTGRVEAKGVDGTTFIYEIKEGGTYRFVCTSTDRVGRLMAMKIADNHNFTETITKNATCTEDGEKHLECNKCGYETTAIIPAAHSYTESITDNATCTTTGTKVYTCTVCNDRITEVIPMTSHSYVNGKCSVCNAVEGGNAVEGAKVHNFTTDGKVSSFFTITGDLSTEKGNITYNGETLSQCLKMESKTKITFTTTTETTLTLVIGGSGSKNSWVVKIDEKNYTPTVVDDADYRIITITLAAGSHTITKGDTTNIYYMIVE